MQVQFIIRGTVDTKEEAVTMKEKIRQALLSSPLTVDMSNIKGNIMDVV